MVQFWLATTLAFVGALVSLVVGCGYDTCPAVDPKKLNIHVISHSHDDVGWQKTADAYADDDVNDIISNVVTELQKNSARRFVQVEMYYFKRWWQRQTTETHQIVKALVKAGQLTFANGGWCMNDEATTHYNQIIDQMTLGIQFIRDTFGECAVPKLSWQIDPFGASREQANLFAMMGFDGHVVNRGSDHLRGEFMWNTSLGHSIFTSRLHNHYSAPKGFDFEDNSMSDDDEYHAGKLVRLAKDWNRDYGNKGHVLIPFGDDFKYKNSGGWFQNIENAIRAVTKYHSDVHIFFSSPHCYIKAIRDLKPKLEVKTEDYFPYWTGYFSSRPQVKSLDRYVNNLLQAAKQLEVIAGLGNTQSLIYEGNNEMGVLQHHDAVSGTSQPPVMKDYRERLTNAIRSVQAVISQALEKLITKNGPVKAHDHQRPFVYTTVNISDYVRHLEGQGFATVVYNPVVQQQQTWVRIPVSEHSTYKVFDLNGAEVKHVSAVPISSKVKALIGHHAQITHELVFSGNLPALGFTTFFVTKGIGKLQENNQKVATNVNHDFVLKGKNFELIVDYKTGKTKSLIKNGKLHKLVQSFEEYKAGMSSNAYEFCPDWPSVDLDKESTVVHAAKYDGFIEITQKVKDYIWQTIRVYEDKEYVEFDQTVGPIDPEDDYLNREIITKYTTDLATNGRFYTDANGRQDITRIRTFEEKNCGDVRNAIWNNYFPVTTAAFIKDQNTGFQMTLIPDRSVGGSSQNDGELELMIHRGGYSHAYVLMDDKDVDGKRMVARGKVRLYLNSKQEASDSLRHANRDVFMQPVVSFIPIANIEGYKAGHNVHFTALKTKLPDNVHLLTLENWGDVKNNEVLVRFENFYQPDDVSKLNKATHFSLDLFATVHMEQVTKGNLVVGHRQVIKSNEVSLSPQEIVTFVYKVKRTLDHTACSFKWEKLVDKKLPTNAIRAGHEVSNSPIYVCRHKDVDLLPGRYSQDTNCHVTREGVDHKFDDNEVEILTSADSNYQWVPRHGGDPLPDKAFVAGHSETGRPLYVGRCAWEGLTVGKIDEYFFYSEDNEEKRAKDGYCYDHEVLSC